MPASVSPSFDAQIAGYTLTLAVVNVLDAELRTESFYHSTNQQPGSFRRCVDSQQLRGTLFLHLGFSLIASGWCIPPMSTSYSKVLVIKLRFMRLVFVGRSVHFPAAPVRLRIVESIYLYSQYSHRHWLAIEFPRLWFVSRAIGVARTLLTRKQKHTQSDATLRSAYPAL